MVRHTGYTPLLQVTVISRGRPADLPEGEEAGCTFRHVDGSTTMASSYANAGLATADAVIIGALLSAHSCALQLTYIDVGPASNSADASSDSEVANLVTAAGEREGVSSKESDAHLLFALMQVCRALRPM